MQTILGKRGSTGNDDNGIKIKRIKEDESTVSISNLTAACYNRLVEFLNHKEIDSLAATCKTMKEKMDTEAIWHLRYIRNIEDSFHDGPMKLYTADGWKNYVFWQRSDIIYSDTTLFGEQPHNVELDPTIAGIKKVVITDCCIFLLDYSGRVHRWDEDDGWGLVILEKVVDIVTDSSDFGRHRSSLFVLSQSERLFQDRPPLAEFYRYRNNGNPPRYFDRILKNWHPNGAPKSGDKVDVYRIENSLRRVFKMTFQQAHRFISLQVSNRDYLKTPEQVQNSDSRGKHINELQLLTTKGRIWSLTVNEPELIASGGGAQVALKNISSRFDLTGDSDETLYVEKSFNGKYISGLVCTNGNLHMFSDMPEKMRKMFPGRTFIETIIGTDQDTKRPSTTVTVGADILDVSISNTHVLILDIFGRLWAIGGNRCGQLGLGHVIDQGNVKLVPLPSNVKRTIAISASAGCSVILCEDKSGSIRAYATGTLSTNDHPFDNMIGYALCQNADHTEPWSRYRAKMLDIFTELDVRLSRHTDTIELTTNQLSFLTRHQVDKKLGFKDLPNNFAFVDNNPCRLCADMEPSWNAQPYENEFYNYVADKSIEWLNEQIAQCECPIGNQVYRSILVNRLVTARQMQKLDDEFETQLDSWEENVTDTEVDQLVDAIALAHSINNQLSPFSSLH